MEGPRTLRAAGVSFTCLLWFCCQPSLFSLSLSLLFSLLSLSSWASRPPPSGRWDGERLGVRAEPARIFLLSSAQRWVGAGRFRREFLLFFPVSTRSPTRQSENGVRSHRGSETCPFRGQVHESKVDAADPSRAVSAWTANYILDSAVPPHREVRLCRSDGLDKTIVRTIVFFRGRFPRSRAEAI